MEHSPGQVDRYEAVRQYTLAQILAVWAAAALPIGILAWVVAPWLRDQLGGEDPFAEALLICITVGLVWQFVLVLILVRRELGRFQWSRVREALWLLPPRDPKSGRVGGRVWWWVLLFILIFALEALISIPGPSVRDFADFLDSDRGEDFFRGAWGWFAVVVVLAIFNTVLGRGAAFPWASAAAHEGCLRKVRLGRQWGAVRRLPLATAVDHSRLPGGHHRPRVPSRRFQSAWMGIIVHSSQSVFVIAVVLGLVLK